MPHAMLPQGSGTVIALRDLNRSIGFERASCRARTSDTCRCPCPARCLSGLAVLALVLVVSGVVGFVADYLEVAVELHVDL